MNGLFILAIGLFFGVPALWFLISSIRDERFERKLEEVLDWLHQGGGLRL